MTMYVVLCILLYKQWTYLEFSLDVILSHILSNIAKNGPWSLISVDPWVGKDLLRVESLCGVNH
jgi:hypothetical protein